MSVFSCFLMKNFPGTPRAAWRWNLEIFNGDGGGKEVIGEGVAGFEGWDPATGEVADK